MLKNRHPSIYKYKLKKITAVRRSLSAAASLPYKTVENNMKMYIVGVNQAAGIVKIVAYESKDIATSQNKRGLRYQQLLGNHFMGPMIESTRKEDCYKYIKANYPASAGWTIEDYSNYKVTSTSSNEHKKMPFHRDVATPIVALRTTLIVTFLESREKLGFYFNVYQYEQPNGEIDLIKISYPSEEKKHVKFKTTDDVVNYILTEARKAVDSAKNKKQLKLAQLYLRNALYVLEQYDSNSRLIG